MAKSSRVRMHCQICSKNTVHEVRIIGDKETCICLQCERTQRAIENAAIRHENNYKASKYETERAIEAERSRTFSPGG